MYIYWEMENSGMSKKLLISLLAVLVFGGSLSAAGDRKSGPELTGDQLLDMACKDFGKEEKDCKSFYDDVPPSQKNNATELGLIALRIASGRAPDLVDAVKGISKDQHKLSPMFQSALADCMAQYDPLEDLIEEAMSAHEGGNVEEAIAITTTAIENMDACDAAITGTENKGSEKDKESQELELTSTRDIKETNLYMKRTLNSAMVLLTAKTK